MKTAEANLETAANINYVYLSTQGSNAASSNTKVVFNISPATSYEESPMPGHYAFTFFPSYKRSSRKYIIFKAGWNQDLNYLFQHELGHILDLRHEHIRWGLTSETTANAQVLTAKDTASFMYYK